MAEVATWPTSAPNLSDAAPLRSSTRDPRRWPRRRRRPRTPRSIVGCAASHTVCANAAGVCALGLRRRRQVTLARCLTSVQAGRGSSDAVATRAAAGRHAGRLARRRPDYGRPAIRAVKLKLGFRHARRDVRARGAGALGDSGRPAAARRRERCLERRSRARAGAARAARLRVRRAAAAADALDELAALRRRAPVRIALDESVATSIDMVRAIEAGAADVVVLFRSPRSSVGRWTLSRIAERCARRRRRVVYTRDGSAVGARTHCIHAAAADGAAASTDSARPDCSSRTSPPVDARGPIRGSPREAPGIRGRHEPRPRAAVARRDDPARGPRSRWRSTGRYRALAADRACRAARWILDRAGRRCAGGAADAGRRAILAWWSALRRWPGGRRCRLNARLTPRDRRAARAAAVAAGRRARRSAT